MKLHGVEFELLYSKDSSLGSGFALLFGFENLCYDLLFFNEEGSNDSTSHTRGTSRTTISTCYSFSTLGQRSEGSWSGFGQTPKLEFAVTAFGHRASFFGVEVDQTSSRCLGDPPLVGVGVVGQSSTKGKSLDHGD